MKQELFLSLVLPDEESFDLFVKFILNSIELLDPDYFDSINLCSVFPNGAKHDIVTSFGKSYFSEDV